MEKITIRLEENQYVDLCNVYFDSRMNADNETRGTVSLYNHITHRLMTRYKKCKPINGLVTRSFTFYVYDWEFILLSIAKYRYRVNIGTYTQITINTVLEKLCNV